MTGIVSTYWWLLHSSVTFILSMRYITWHKTKTGGISMTVYSYKKKCVSGIIIIPYCRLLEDEEINFM